MMAIHQNEALRDEGHDEGFVVSKGGHLYNQLLRAHTLREPICLGDLMWLVVRVKEIESKKGGVFPSFIVRSIGPSRR